MRAAPSAIMAGWALQTAATASVQTPAEEADDASSVDMDETALRMAIEVPQPLLEHLLCPL